jgi:D-alanyl-D-alanine carboxypeptidase (penicillin-binding protein 5/6)
MVIHWMRTVLLLMLVILAGYATAANEVPPPPSFASPELNQIPVVPAAPQIAASSYILMAAETGEILVEHNASQELPPASLTKMMTSYVLDYEIAKGNVSFEDMVPISVQAWKTGGSKMFVQEGTQVRLEDLLRGIVIQSGNDASIAIAEFLAGSEDAFATIMNQHAARLGMTHSHFLNATGLPLDNHYSSARDLAILARAIVYDFPQQYPLYAEKDFTYNNIRQPNRNLLLWRDKSVDGLKTGHTTAAGYCLVASAVREGMRLISVVMGTRSEEARAQETMKLLNYGFRFFETHSLYSRGQELLKTRLWGAAEDEVAIGLARDIRVTIPRGQKGSLNAKVDVDTIVKGPVETGQTLGTLRIELDGKTLVSEPVVALQSVEEAGFFKRIWHAIVLFFKALFA